ncbi:sugar ABC transporter permease [Lactococcus hodotermopsidis]|uniref:Sugar ABC transporter permease n=1 Tax=Pseudolactococcus hodotermopsidis TaxID=2709157 RepID=A0A6A0BET4_9LACT|nr:ABC transporter permease [Lactococcus hodotermopsidis]GFH42347.1 sugar ABC transporter permease [Lactococcus hodotermopsidis]
MKNLNIRKGLIPIIAVLAGFVLGAIIMLAFGYNPIWGYEDLLTQAFGNAKSIGEIFRSMGPLVLTALSFAVAMRAGMFNIGMSGQALAGWIMSAWFALSYPDLSRVIMMPLLLIIGAFSGALIAALSGVLKAFLGTSEVIVTIMMNYIVLFVSTHMAHHIFPKKLMTSQDSTMAIGDNASFRLDFLSKLTNNSRINIGIFIAIIATIIVAILLKRTTLGFEIRAVGLNPNASEYAGISAKRTIITSMVISGGLAGLAGVVDGLGTFQNFFVQSTNMSIGFDGMAVALLGENSPVGILFAALLFSILKIGAPGMNVTGIPPEIVNVVIASIIFFVGIKFVIEKILPTLPKKESKKEEVNS